MRRRLLSPYLLAASCCALHLPAAGCAESVDSDAIEVATGAGGPTGGGSSGIEAPVLLEVAPLSLVLKITWETQAFCETIEGERKAEAEPYAVAFEVPGTDTVYVDEEATEDRPYTYRLRCKRGEAASDYSNEKTGNPEKP